MSEMFKHPTNSSMYFTFCIEVKTDDIYTIYNRYIYLQEGSTLTNNQCVTRSVYIIWLVIIGYVCTL